MLFIHSPKQEATTFEAARGRAAHLRRRLDKLHKETLQGLKPEHRPGTSRPTARPTSPPRPGTSNQALASQWTTPPCQPGASLSAALTTEQLEQIKTYLQGQQLLPEDKNDEGASTSARSNTESPQDDLFVIPLLPSYRIAFRNHFEGVTWRTDPATTHSRPS